MTALAVLRKELLETLRERKFLMKSAAWVVLIGVALGALSVVAYSNIDLSLPQQPIGIGVQDTRLLPPQLVQELQRSGIQLIASPGNLEAAVRAGRFPAAMLLQPDSSAPPMVTLIANSSAADLEHLIRMYELAIARYDSARLSALSQTHTPAVTEQELMTPKQRRGAELAPTIVIALLALVQVVGMALLVDSVYGEKDRGTLEALLHAAGRGGEVVLGKLLRILLLLSVLLLLCAGAIVAGRTLLMKGAWGYGETLATLQGLLLALELYAIVLLLCAFAPTFIHSSRQGGYFCNVIIIVVVALAALASMGVIQLPVAVPVIGQGALIRELFLNGAVSAWRLLVCSIGTVVFCLACQYAVARGLSRERWLYAAA